jgi:hypothetical protein
MFKRIDNLRDIIGIGLEIMEEYNTLCDLDDRIADIKERIMVEEESIEGIPSEDYHKVIESSSKKIIGLLKDLNHCTQKYENILKTFIENFTENWKKGDIRNASIDRGDSIPIRQLGKLLHMDVSLKETKYEEITSNKNVYYYGYMTTPREFDFVDLVGLTRGTGDSGDVGSVDRDITSIIERYDEMEKYGVYIDIYTNGILLRFGGCS